MLCGCLCPSVSVCVCLYLSVPVCVCLCLSVCVVPPAAVCVLCSVICLYSS